MIACLVQSMQDTFLVSGHQATDAKLIGDNDSSEFSLHRALNGPGNVIRQVDALASALGSKKRTVLMNFGVGLE